MVEKSKIAEAMQKAQDAAVTDERMSKINEALKESMNPNSCTTGFDSTFEKITFDDSIKWPVKIRVKTSVIKLTEKEVTKLKKDALKAKKAGRL